MFCCHTKMWQNTQKQLKIDPSQAACLADSRGQNVALGSAINQLFTRTCGKTRTKAAENRPCAAKMWRNTEESSSRSYIFTRKCGQTHKSITKMWQNTQKHLKIDPSQGPNTMAWRVQPRRFSSMSDVKTSRLNPL